MLMGYRAENRRAQFPVVSNTAQSVRITAPRVDLEAGASLLRQPTRAVMVRGEFQVAPLDFARRSRAHIQFANQESESRPDTTLR